jgi:hypothetical protein
MKIFTIALAISTALTLILKVSAQESSPATATTSSSTTATTQKADTEWDGVSVELTGVTKGAGDTITVKWKYTNNGSKQMETEHSGVADKAYYVDPGNKKKYLVVKDAQGNLVASGLEFFQLKPGASRAGWAKFPAPPTGVSKIDIYLPGAPPFEGVAIQ